MSCLVKVCDFVIDEWLRDFVDVQVRKRSAQKNNSFQKLFSLPAEEFLINDFACAIKRKIPIQV